MRLLALLLAVLLLASPETASEPRPGETEAHAAVASAAVTRLSRD